MFVKMSYGTFNHKGSLITRWALRVCGLSAIQNLSYIDLGLESPKSFIDGLWTNTAPGSDSYSKSGNLLFAFTSNQYKQRKTLPVLRHLLEHPNTKIIHFYKNNAHGPSIVFIAIHHVYPKQVKREIVNNVEKVLSFVSYEDYEYVMKKGAEDAL
jgi:hypothetical protein